jgi:MinD-like ATPase involved in chromosome partitioning or flagellar assembly
VTALLAMLFAAVRDDRVAVVDANPESGALSQWLVPDAGLRPDVYRSLFQPDVTPAAVSGALVGAGPRLAVLPSAVDATTHRNEDAAAWTRLIEHLGRLHHVVLLDCGAGLRRPSVQACLAAADQVVLVTRRAEPGDLGTSKPMVLVVNQAARRSRTNRPALGAPQVTLMLDTRSAALLKRGGFAWSQAPAAWQEAVRELAALLVASG